MMKFKGVMPALVSPLDANEQINIPVLNQLLNNLLAKGADGFYLCGATGEGIAIAPEQRMILAEEAIKNALKDYFDKNNIPYDKKQFPDCEHCHHCE